MNIGRDCQVCESDKKRFLFHQYFSKTSKYDVVVCEDCGFAYADNNPDQEELNLYYHNLYKYNHPELNGGQTNFEKKHFPKIANLISSLLPNKDTRVLEIGCANGALLNEMKKLGFENVWGLDPSPISADCANRLYDIPVMTGTIYDLPSYAKFDFIILVAVLEHIADLRTSLQIIGNSLSISGMVFIETPDATRYSYDTSPYAPFMEFSREHINYFSSVSLNNLMSSMRWRNKFETRYDYGKNGGVVLRSMFKKGFNRDKLSEIALKSYIEDSDKAEKRALDTINMLAADQTPVVVWGVGSHTMRLLDDIRKMNIVAYVDSTRSEGEWDSKPIIRMEDIPLEICGKEIKIFLSTREHAKAILKQIDDLKIKNPVLVPYG